MKTWRERYVEAVARGYFTDEDKMLWRDVLTCPAAEAAEAYGLPGFHDHGMPFCSQLRHPYCLWTIGNRLESVMERLDLPEVAGPILDAIEDRALQLKRESV